MENNANEEIKYYNLSIPQESIWITEQFYSGTNINNITGYVQINSQADLTQLQNAINQFIKNNDAIRSRFILDDNGNLKQYFKPHSDETFEIVHLNNLSEFEELKETIKSRKFQIFDNQLYNFYLYSINGNEGGFIYSSHHLIGDAWAMKLLINQITDTYYSLVNHLPIDCKENSSYFDFIAKNQTYIDSVKYKKDMDYWNTIFSSKIDTENAKQHASIEAKRITFTIEKELLTNAKKLDDSFFNVYLSALSLYFTQIKNLKNILIGVPLLNRANCIEKNTVGMFINTVPLRIDIDHNLSFKEFLELNKTKEFSLFKHQRLSYENILNIANKTNPDIDSLFDIVVSYQNARDNHQESSLDYQTGWIFNNAISNSLDIHITDLDDTGILQISYDYQLDKYNEKDIIGIHNRILNIIRQAINNSSLLLQDVELITASEKEELLALNNLHIDFPKNLNIINMFQKQVEQRKNEIAIWFEDNKITYQELDKKSDILASALIKNNTKQGDIIGILLPRSIDLFICILGILKAGGIYLPIDVEFPDNRIHYMLTNSNAKFCITNSEQAKRVKCTLPLLFDDIINLPLLEKLTTYNIKNTDGCYIIYTSGSTGEPKGVLATHSNVVNYVFAFQNEFRLTESDIVLQQFTPSFDAFVEEFYPALLSGAKIFSVSKNTIYNFKKLENYINTYHISLISCSPLLLNELNKLEPLKSVKTFISGGDALKSSFYSNLITYANVYNTYGPTETTVCSLYHKCKLNDENVIPIGKTIANYKNFIMNENNQLLPKGELGELHIGGNGITKGYLNNKELTNSKFIKANSIHEKVYKTGDLCRINSNNDVEFYGRKDTQLKIRGYRISLDEIEKMINQYPGVSNSVVIDFEESSNQKRLCAYYVCVINISSKEIQEYLEKVLPHYMIPSIYYRIDSIPMTINGKVDKKQLPNPLELYCQMKKNYIAPTTETEKKLEGIWKKILKLDKIGIDENLFDIGADSLSVIQFQTLSVNENWDIDAQEIYSNASIEKLAKKLERSLEKDTSEYEKFKSIDIKELSLPSTNRPRSNILLTGTTGFLGIHILDELLNNSNSTVYCLIRGKDKSFAEERLNELYRFYFNTDIKSYKNRIKLLFGDISKKNLGLSSKCYENLTNKIDLVIHTAAIVKHYGNEEIFNEINIVGTQNIIDFCLSSHSELHHISTISVSGTTTLDHSTQNFTENSFWIHQNYQDNVYVKSKFEAEYKVLEAIKTKNLYAKIYRVGNLTGRYRDGFFQKNIESNAFYKKIQTIFELKKIPDDIKNVRIDFTPIDLVSQAICKIVFSDTSGQIIYHLYNSNIISLHELIDIFNKIGYDIQILPSQNLSFSSESENEKLNSLIYNIYPTENKDTINISNVLTDINLSKLDFHWNEIDKKYIIKIIDYMKKTKFVEEKNDE